MDRLFPLLAIPALMALPLASTAQDFEVSPVNLIFTASPGTMQNQEFIITNHSTSEAVFGIRIEDYDIDEEGVRHTRARGTNMYSCAPWLTVSPTLMGVDPGSQGQVKVSMSVPADGRESRWCQLVVFIKKERTSLSADVNAAGVNLSPEIVMDVSQNPLGISEYKAQLSNFQEVENVDGKPGSRFFHVVVTNHGRTNVQGTMYVVAANMDDLSESEIMKQQVRVKAGGSLKVKMELTPDMLVDGEYDFTCLYDMGPQVPLRGIKLKKNVVIER